MEEPAVLQEKTEGLWEGGQDRMKADWKNERSLSSLLKHSCFLCWSSPRDPDVVEMDERVITKTAEIRELENALAVENLELQEQQLDHTELEETLVKLEKHKETLIQQIKTIRQLCYNESQQILALQADEMQKESQVEEYERELARARWRLRNLREEVKQARRKVEEAGEKNTPLQDSIRQSYEEILQEERTLCSLSGGGVTPDSQLESTSADTTEDDPLPMRPWGRSQSLPAYADLIMRASSFCNLAGTREEANHSGPSSPKMDGSYIEDDPVEREIIKEGDKDIVREESAIATNPLSQLDFYEEDPFAHCQSEHDLFNEDLFPKTDSSDGFASDPFKGSDPFAAEVLFPKLSVATDERTANAGDEADTSLSCAENKASTGTQCFETEFPDEDSDIEISYSHEDLENIAVADESCGFKPIESSTEELGADQIWQWRSRGQYSTESDPNGYELDLGAVSPPSDIEEHTLGSLEEETNMEQMGGTEQGLVFVPVLSKEVLTEPPHTGNIDQTVSQNTNSCRGSESVCDFGEKWGNASTSENPPDFQNLFLQPDCDLDSELSVELSYEPASHSFDPYGFKLSPEHSTHTLLDPDEAESPEPTGNDLTFVSEQSSSQPDQGVLNPYDFDIASSQMARDSDPYGFKLRPEPENQEDLDLCGHDNLEAMDLCNYDNKQVNLSNYSNQVVPEPQSPENQEVLEHCSHDNQELLHLYDHRNQEPSNLDNVELLSNENQEVLELSSHENQEVVELYCNNATETLVEVSNNDDQEALEPSNSNRELPDLSCCENQEVLYLDNHCNQELLDLGSSGNEKLLFSCSHDNQELLDVCSTEDHKLLGSCSDDNQEVLDIWGKDISPEANNNQCSMESEIIGSPTNYSSDSDVASTDQLGRQQSNTSICTSNQANTDTADSFETPVSSVSANQDFAMFNAPTIDNLLEGDLGSVFGAGGYISCPDVAEDLELMQRRQARPAEEPVQLMRPVRPPRPSLMAKEKCQSKTQGIDLK